MKDFAQHGWKEVSLGDICEKTETVDPRKAPEDEFDYVDVSSVSNETFTIGGTQRLLGADAPSRARRKIRSGDILFATIRPTLQRIAQVPEHLDGQVCSTGYIVLRPRPALDARFLMHSLFRPDFFGAMESLQSGASYPAVTDKQVRAQTIPIPPLEEQQRIVAVLDEAFEGLARARAHAEANLQNAGELFDSILESAVALDTAQYGVKPVETLATEVTDGDHMPPPKAQEGIPFITISNIRRDTREIDFSDTFKVPQSYFDALKEKRRPKAGDILYTVTGATLGIPVLIQEDRDFCFQRHIGLVRPTADANSAWLYYMLMSPYAFKQATDGASGAAQKTVSLKTLRRMKVPNAPKRRQEELVTFFKEAWTASADAKARYAEKLKDLDDLRQSLLQKAFAGELT